MRTIIVILTLIAIGTAVAAQDGATVSVATFGATGAGLADETAAVQAAIDSFGERGGTLLFPPGTYRITSVKLRPGIRYLGYGATILRPPLQGKWTRTFVSGENAYSSDEDSAPLTIEGFVFDGNMAEQGEYTGYQLEQAHLLFLSADPSRPGLLRVRVLNCDFQNCVADAISIYTNVEAQIINCTAVDCFRGGITITGGNSRVQVTNFVARGKTHPTGIDVEIDGAGFGGSVDLHLTMSNVLLPDGDFDVGVGGNSVVMGSQIVARAPFNVYGGGTATLMFSDCAFGVGELSDYGNRIVLPGHVTFRNCRFTLEPDGAVEPRRRAAAHIFWGVAGHIAPRQSVRFIDCVFEADPAIPEGDTTYAVLAQADQLEHHNHLELRGCRIGSGLDYGVFLRQGGRVTVQDTAIAADTALRLGAAENYYVAATIDAVDATGRLYAHIVTHAPQNRILHRNMHVPEAQSLLETTYGLAGNTYLGGRVIYGAQEPTPATHGLPGDIYRLQDAAGRRDWLCTAAGSGSGAQWRQLAAVAE